MAAPRHFGRLPLPAARSVYGWRCRNNGAVFGICRNRGVEAGISLFTLIIPSVVACGLNGVDEGEVYPDSVDV
eukprot:5749838-Pleurochrysis_carterae.AAC.1